MTLSEILDTVLLESGMNAESSYADNSKDEIKRLVNLANRSVQRLARYPWQVLRKTWSFTLSDDVSYTLPDDYRAFIADTMYSDSNLEGVDFPANESEWAYLQASSGGTDVSVKARLIGGTMQIYEPNSGETIQIEYISKYPVLNASGAAKERFTADDDTTLLDDDLMAMDIIWRHKKLVGLDYQPDLAEFTAMKIQLWGQEAGSKTVRPGHEVAAETPYYNLWRPSSEAV